MGRIGQYNITDFSGVEAYHHEPLITVYPSWIHSLQDRTAKVREWFQSEPPIELGFPRITGGNLYGAALTVGTFLSSTIATGFFTVEAVAYAGAQAAYTLGEVESAQVFEQTMLHNQTPTAIAVGAFAFFGTLGMQHVNNVKKQRM